MKKMKKAVKHAMKAGWQTLSKVTMILVITTEFTMAQTGGLAKAKGVMDSFKTELTDIIPTVAVIALLALGIGYATKFVEKDTFVRWAIGIIIAGSAAQLTALFFT